MPQISFHFAVGSHVHVWIAKVTYMLDNFTFIIVCVYPPTDRFKHCTTSLLFTDDPGDLASEEEAEHGYLEKYSMDEPESSMERVEKICGLQQVVS